MSAPPAPVTAQELAERVNAARLVTLGMLVAGVAHEINTPLGALHSNHDTLKRTVGRLQAILSDEVVTPDELQEVRRVVRALDGVLHINDLAVERMTALVRSLRSFGRPDRAEVGLVDLHESIDSALLILGHELRDRVRVDRDYGELPAVECYGSQLGQVFMNLLLNAIQAIPSQGVIEIRTAAEADGVVVRIADNGVGIAPGHLEHIFEPGFTTKGTRVGMGLGLLIARQVVEMHGGRLDVESQPGNGTTFEVRLPLRLPE